MSLLSVSPIFSLAILLLCSFICLIDENFGFGLLSCLIFCSIFTWVGLWSSHKSCFSFTYFFISSLLDSFKFENVVWSGIISDNGCLGYVSPKGTKFSLSIILPLFCNILQGLPTPWFSKFHTYSSSTFFFIASKATFLSSSFNLPFLLTSNLLDIT